MQTAAPFFTSLFGGHGSNSNNNNHNEPTSPNHTKKSPASKSSRSRPPSSGVDAGGGRAGDLSDGDTTGASPRRHNVLHKSRDRRPSFGRKTSFSLSTSSPKRRANSSSSANGGSGTVQQQRPPAIQLFPDDSPVPPLPELTLTAAALSKLSKQTEAIVHSPTSAEFSRMAPGSRSNAPTPVNGQQLAPPPVLHGSGIAASVGLNGAGAGNSQNESTIVHHHIQEMANKRISTLDYLRKAHEGRIYWFNTLLFDKPDLQRMPYFDSRKIARRATNYFLLGISLPAVIDLNSSSATEFLRSFNTLLTEFDSFQQLHSESGTTSSSLSRARIPQMFRRATGPVSSKGRRSSSATGATIPGSSSNGTDTGGGYAETTDSLAAATNALAQTMTNSSATYPTETSMATSTQSAPMNFAGSEIDLLPGEEYTHLLTPSLPFDPDFFETFATLCDVLIDTYTRLLSLIPTPNQCGPSVAELFQKADAKVRKLLVQSVIREFEDQSRQGVKAEVANVGKVVLSGLM
ncbi:hypothetical protein QBC35DRAFT_14169 [Podospora australis]|uniref:Uncharacterized protein n=1 Tax=Podospora australis TaxID=1536484 RepID=A0AAN6X1E2_9PEZI|nr:hypothetical protein QBC35DRAFT_14169 [Podospora australis]